MHSGDMQGASDEFKASINLDPGKKDAYFNLVLALKQAGMDEEGAKWEKISVNKFGERR
jgi:hypothetical protein